MESEKVKEIKKALEQNDDNGIMYEVNDQKRTCKFIHHKDILTLINDLESENKSLQDLCNKTYEDLTKEIDRLEESNKKLKQSNKNILFVNDQLIKQNTELKNRIAELEKELQQ